MESMLSAIFVLVSLYYHRTYAEAPYTLEKHPDYSVLEVSGCTSVQKHNYLSRLAGYKAAFIDHEESGDQHFSHIVGSIRVGDVRIISVKEEDLKDSIPGVDILSSMKNLLRALNTWGLVHVNGLVYPTCERVSVNNTLRAFVIPKEKFDLHVVPHSELELHTGLKVGSSGVGDITRSASRLVVKEYSAKQGLPTFRVCDEECGHVEIAAFHETVNVSKIDLYSSHLATLYKLSTTGPKKKELHLRIMQASFNLLYRNAKFRHLQEGGGELHPHRQWLEAFSEQHKYEANRASLHENWAIWKAVEDDGKVTKMLSISRSIWEAGTNQEMEALLLKSLAYAFKQDAPECTVKPKEFAGIVSCFNPCPRIYFKQIGEKMLCTVDVSRSDLGIVAIKFQADVPGLKLPRVCESDPNEFCFGPPPVSMGETIGIVVGIVSTLVACLSLALAIYQHKKQSGAGSQEKAAKGSITNSVLSGKEILCEA